MVESSTAQAPAPGAPARGAPPGRLGWKAAARDLARGHLGCEALTWITLVNCLMLQRLALPAGGSLKISLATPVVLGAALFAVASGTVVVERRRMSLYLGLVAVGLCATAVQMNVPLAIAPRMSLTSLLYWLAITGFAVLRFRRPMGEQTFFAIVLSCLLVVAVAGIGQFFLQFVGVRLFEFTGIVPDRLLIEDQYAVVIPMDAGINKSNGFFLIEPSVFSQIMALGIILETQAFRRPFRLALFFIGLLVSASGTGWLVLGSYIVVLAFGAGLRGLLGAVLLAGGCAVAFGALSLVNSDMAASMSSRLDEFTLPGSSGNERFVTPFMALGYVWTEVPWAALTGIGPGASEQLTVPFFYRLNTPVKVVIEYGVFGLFFYMALLIRGHRTHKQTLLLVPCLVLLLVAGGYHQFSPILFLVILLCDTAYLTPDTA